MLPRVMMRRVLETDRSWTLLALRVAVAAIVFPHGAQKLFGWFGGSGFDGTMSYFADALGMPAPLGFAVILVESVGSLALVVGALTRPVAVGLFAVMVGAIALVHAPNGFFMNWFGKQAGEGFEFHLLVLAIAGVLAVRGGGALSVDRALALARGRTREESPRTVGDLSRAH